jgi:predicted transglutaminase-like cysteine proteinase
MARIESRNGKLALRAVAAMLCVVPFGSAAALSSLDSKSGPNAQSLVESPAFHDVGETGRGRCANAPAAGFPVSVALAADQQSKSSAIAGGTSALELMRNEQVTFAQPVAASPADEAREDAAIMTMAQSLEPALGGKVAEQADCSGGGQPAAFVRPGMNQLPSAAPRSSDFLQSRRVPIGSTRFDAQWRRVSDSSISLGQYNRIVGKRPARGTELLERVNAWVNNNIRYTEDAQLWGSTDYWATASETLLRARGDCEDLAIVKMKLLERAGISRDDMYLTVARDLYRNADHAFLVVKLDGRYFVLDNAVDRILPANQDLGYRPVLSFSNHSSWLHGY